MSMIQFLDVYACIQVSIQLLLNGMDYPDKESIRECCIWIQCGCLFFFKNGFDQQFPTSNPELQLGATQSICGQGSTEFQFYS